MRGSSPEPTVSVQVASLAIFAFAAVQLVGTVTMLRVGKIADARLASELITKQILFVVLIVTVGIFVRRLHRWAWWVTVVMGVLYGIGGIVVLREAAGGEGVFSGLIGATTTIMTICPWAAAIALLTPAARAAFGFGQENRVPKADVAAVSQRP